ncbi:hypothetical protein Dimus_010186, partial [Dionaea muscipula]
RRDRREGDRLMEREQVWLHTAIREEDDVLDALSTHGAPVPSSSVRGCGGRQGRRRARGRGRT